MAFNFGGGTNTGGANNTSSSTSIFGQPASNAPVFKFGSSATDTSKSDTNNQTDTKADKPTSLFASPSAFNTGSSLFGSTSKPAQPAFGTTPAVFGQTDKSDKPSNLFGFNSNSSSSTNQNANPSSITNKPSATSLFGTVPSNGTAANPGLFGTGTAKPTDKSTDSPQQDADKSMANTSTFPSSLSGTSNLFGAKSDTNKPSTGLFGASDKPSTGLFGASDKPATGLFGASTDKPATGLFGASTDKPATGFAPKTESDKPATGLFGASDKPATGLFGASTDKPATGLFGASTDKPATGLFGASTDKPATGLFGASTDKPATGLFGTSTDKPATGFAPKTESDKPASTGFGAKTDTPATGLFGAKTDTPASSGFGAKTDKPASSGFGAEKDKPGTSAAEKTETKPLQPPTYLKNKSLEDIIAKWTTALSKSVDEFQSQAANVAMWDRVLVDNGQKLAVIFNEVVEAEQSQGSVDQMLEYVGHQQDDMDALLTSYEQQASAYVAEMSGPEGLQPVDLERERAYRLSKDLADKLEHTGTNLRRVIQDTNSISALLGGADDNDPVTHIVRVLNSHLSSLQWIDEQCGQLQRRLDGLKELPSL